MLILCLRFQFMSFSEDLTKVCGLTKLNRSLIFQTVVIYLCETYWTSVLLPRVLRLFGYWLVTWRVSGLLNFFTVEILW